MAGQTISDRLLAAKHSLAGQGLAKSVCKATTEELLGPKKKHLDYLIHCTNEPNVSIPQLANLLIERSQNTNWIVVFKALITVHHLMCYGNERFTQYLASSNSTFQLSNFLDKSGVQGYDMSPFIRRYARYLNEKALSYRTVAFDFCKVKRGKEDGVLRTMNADKLLKTLPVLQSQLDALLEFDCSAADLSNGVINMTFMLLFRDLIRLFAGYNDSIINLLEKYFDMNKKQCREALDLYKKFLIRMDRVGEFLKVAENIGIDKGEIPDLTKAPSSLLDALEQHLAALEGRKSAANTPTQAAVTQHRSDVKTGVNALSSTSSAFGTAAAAQQVHVVDETVAKQIVAEEEAILNQYKSKVQSPVSSAGISSTTNPFLNSPTQPIVDLFSIPGTQTANSTSQVSKASDDLLQLGNPFADGFPPQPAPVTAAPTASAAPTTNNIWMTNGFGTNVNSNSCLTNAFVDDRSFTSVFGDTNHLTTSAAAAAATDGITNSSNSSTIPSIPLDIFGGNNDSGRVLLDSSNFCPMENEGQVVDTAECKLDEDAKGSAKGFSSGPPPRPPPPSSSGSRTMSPTAGNKTAMDDLNDSIRVALGNSPSRLPAASEFPQSQQAYPPASVFSQSQQPYISGSEFPQARQIFPTMIPPQMPGMIVGSQIPNQVLYGSPIKYPSVISAGANVCVSTTTTAPAANKVLTGDLDSSLASLAENLSINKTTQQTKPVQWNSPKNPAKTGATSAIWNPQPMAATTGANYRPMGMPTSNLPTAFPTAAYPAMGMQGMTQVPRMQAPAASGMVMLASGMTTQQQSSAISSQGTTLDPFGTM